MNGFDRDPRGFLAALFDAAVKAADPVSMLAAHLPPPPRGRTVVVGAGKAAVSMARAFERHWKGDVEGVVVVPRGQAKPLSRIRVIEAAHPVPDSAGLEASRQLLAAVSGLGGDDLVVALLSGGGSALLPAPVAGLTLEDEIALNRALLASGAPIGVMNLIRRQISRIKGGGLARAAGTAAVVSLILSDVPGDDPAEVASGPTIMAEGGPKAALAAARRYRIALPQRVADFLARAPEGPAPGPLPRHVHRIVGSAALSLEAAADLCLQHGIDAAILSDAIEGEARVAGGMHAALAREVARRNRPFARPVVLLSGGETTVTLRGKGKGGRNTEFLLALAMAIEGETGISALAADTDGIDGSEDNAGAFADGTSIERMRRAGIDAADRLADNDAWTAFAAAGDLLVTGPTGTNVNDFRAILVR